MIKTEALEMCINQLHRIYTDPFRPWISLPNKFNENNIRHLVILYQNHEKELIQLMKDIINDKIDCYSNIN